MTMVAQILTTAINWSIKDAKATFHHNKYNRCWGNEAPHMYVLIVPVVVSIFLNLLFVFNIVRVLLLKLKAPMGPQAVGGQSRNILQAFR